MSMINLVLSAQFCCVFKTVISLIKHHFNCVIHWKGNISMITNITLHFQDETR